MGRSPVFIKASNDYREVSVGGQKKSYNGRVWLNAENAQGESGVNIYCQVRNVGDGEFTSTFNIHLPEIHENCRVFINGKEYGVEGAE